MKFFDLFSVPISITSKDQALAVVTNWLRRWRTPKVIVTPNPEIIVSAQKDPEFLKALQSADLSIPDGIGIVWAIKILAIRQSVAVAKPVSTNGSDGRNRMTIRASQPKPPDDSDTSLATATVSRYFSRLSGLDFMESLIALAAQKGWKVMLVGGKPGVAKKAAEKLQVSVLSCQFSANGQSVFGQSVSETVQPKTGKPQADNRKQKTDNFLQIKSVNGPPDIDKATPHEFNDLLNSINSFQPDLLFVSFGHGKQEKWLRANRRRLHAGVAMGVGGALDQIADPSLRPPSYINSIGLGWLYRLIRQPWRIKRQLALLKFVWMVMKDRILEDRNS